MNQQTVLHFAHNDRMGWESFLDWHVFCIMPLGYKSTALPPMRERRLELGGQTMRLHRDYALGWVLLALFLVIWVGQTFVGWQEFVAEQQEHQQVAEVFGSDGYVWNWAPATFENWQSEFLQLFAMVTLTSFLIFKGSAESKDGDEEMKQALARLERRLEELAAVNPSGNGAGPAQPVGVAGSRAVGD
jgi:hypothetical protein